jgi:hypothetical protein
MTFLQSCCKHHNELEQNVGDNMSRVKHFKVDKSYLEFFFFANRRSELRLGIT